MLRNAVWLLLLVTLPGLAWAGPHPLDAFIRVRPHISLDTSISGYPIDTGAEVDLIGVVHVGEVEYYRRLNRMMDIYDAVLFEMVIDEDPRRRESKKLAQMILKNYEAPKPEIRGGKVSNFQTSLARTLGLAFQLDHIDYSKASFVHADMTMDEFNASMRRRKDKGPTLLDLFKNKSPKGELNSVEVMRILAVGPTPSERYALRRTLAWDLTEMDGTLARMNGRDGGSTLIHVRNARAFDVLRQTLAKGPRRVAVFYGAAHMPDMEKRLLKDFKARLSSRTWLSAWKLSRN